MKLIYLTTLFLVLSIISIPQEIQHEAVAINIEVPVRVFRGDKFIDNLTINDFEIYENGVLQKIDAVYLIKKTTIEKAETGEKNERIKNNYTPNASSRHFILVFELIDYSSDLKEVIDYFFENVFMPNDQLVIVTPLTTYNLKNEIINLKPKDKIADELHIKLKKDIRAGNWEYKSILRDIYSGSATFDDYLRLKELRHLEEKKLLNFAENLKSIDGQKNVFLLYQKDAIPVPKAQEISFVFSPIGNLGLDITFDVDRVKQAFSDSSISAHFLYLSKPNQHNIDVTRIGTSNMALNDWSMNIFSAFNEVAKATGGTVDSSANPAYSFKKAVNASENYYLLYYTPKNYEADEKFKNIKVKVKSGHYRITHRAGYFAN